VNEGVLRRSAPRRSTDFLPLTWAPRRSFVRRSQRMVTGISEVSRFSAWNRRMAPRFTMISTPCLVIATLCLAELCLRDEDADFTGMFRVVIGTTAQILESENQCLFSP